LDMIFNIIWIYRNTIIEMQIYYEEGFLTRGPRISFFVRYLNIRPYLFDAQRKFVLVICVGLVRIQAPTGSKPRPSIESASQEVTKSPKLHGRTKNQASSCAELPQIESPTRPRDLPQAFCGGSVAQLGQLGQVGQVGYLLIHR
jgi:hypothetical protein